MKTLFIATRGSALALAQANHVLAQCRAAVPDRQFELKIIKTTGDKLQTASLAREGTSLPKGLFTKELEIALLNGDADLAVHSLKDLPTELPKGLKLAAVGRREDVRDVLLYRDARHQGPGNGRGYQAGLRISDLPSGAVVATSSTRRKAQVLVANPELKTPDIRGNVATRMRKLVEKPELDATILALAGMNRLGFRINSDGKIEGPEVPPGLLASLLTVDEMLPCVGQGAVGIETRSDDAETDRLCSSLNHEATRNCVVAERAFLAAMGGGCQSPVAAFAELVANQLRMRAVSFASEPVRRGDLTGPASEPVALGTQMSQRLKGLV